MRQPALRSEIGETSMLIRSIALSAALLLGACATTSQEPSIERMLAGESEVSGPALDRRIAEAERHPLGSQENPVRAEMPPGQRDYLARLRCSDGRAPLFEREGSFG